MRRLRRCAGGAKGLGFFPPAAWTGDVGEAIAERFPPLGARVYVTGG